MKHFLLSVALTLGASFSQAQYFALLKSPELVMPGVKKIALLDIQGKDGKEVTDMLTTQLLAKRRGSLYSKWTLLGTETMTGPIMQPNGSASIFELAERGQLEKVLAEQRLSNSGVVDDAQAAKLGKVLGIDAMLMGSCTYSTGMVNEGEYRKRWVSAKVTMKVVDVNTGRVLGIKTEEESRESKGKYGEALVGEHDLAISAYDDATVRLANYINPYFKVYNFPLEKVKLKEHSDNAKRAMKMVEDNKDLVAAYTIYKSISDADPYCAEALGNMGQISLITGNFAQALSEFERAAEIDAERYRNQADFAKARIADLDVLASLGVHPGSVPIAATDPKAMAKMVQTRGGKGDRYSVYAQTQASGEPVAKVPGDTKFEILEVNGEWILIRLLGGKQGYISKNDVRL